MRSANSIATQGFSIAAVALVCGLFEWFSWKIVSGVVLFALAYVIEGFGDHIDELTVRVDALESQASRHDDDD